MSIIVSGLQKVYTSHGRRNVVLDNINMHIWPGLKVALLGRNGAGKSTLIRLISKIEAPTRGTVEHRMSVSWPLGFGGTFQGSLTGIDNIKFIARIYRADYDTLRGVVEDFAELGAFLYQPVKTYSSGMRARLAFALSIAIDFDCYLIDEVIMVGDMRFHARCQEHLFDRKADRALVIASHDASFITRVCDCALIVWNGQVHYFADVAHAVHVYHSL